MPRPGEQNTRAAHPPPARAAAAPQVQHHQTPPRSERTTENASTTNRNVRITLTRFKDGFERQTENELAYAFSRPPRMFKEDNPFYPWLPKPEPLVNFHLNYKF